jgi:hypothetical protein
MARQSAAVAPLVFRGQPHRLSLSDSTLAGHDRGEILLPEALAAHSRSATVSLPVRGRGSRPASLRLRLDRTAPPGRHRAELRLAGKSIPVELDIAPSSHVRMTPGSLDFVGAPGASVEARVLLANDGNVPVELPAQAAASLYDGGGPAAALIETCRQGNADASQIIGCWLGALRAGCSVIELSVAGGAVDLPPGAEREITLGTRLSRKLLSGHSYYGLCNLGPTYCLIGVDVRK